MDNIIDFILKMYASEPNLTTVMVAMMCFVAVCGWRRVLD